jgi:hypothetical protein
MLLMTAFTVVLAPSVVHADRPTFKVIKVLTTDASGNSAPANALRLGDRIRIVVRADAGDNGPPRITAVGGNVDLKVNGITGDLPLVHPTATGNLVDYVDDDSNLHTGDLVYGYTIEADDTISTGLSIASTSVLGLPHVIEDQNSDSAFTGTVTFASGVVAALAAIRADGSRVRPPPATDEPSATDEPVKIRRRIIYQCPIGWTRGSLFGNTKKALIYELKVEADTTNRTSIYQLKSLAIYVHPDENLETLDGWTLKVGTLYNQFGKEFKFTAENSVIDEHDFAHIENPEDIPIPMGTLGYIGQSLPSFDYRLYDATGVRVDFSISCYKAGGLTWRLWNTKDPRLLRVLPLGKSEEALSVQMHNLDWNTPFFRSEWTAAIMPDLPDVPAAPSQVQKPVVGTWADLKKQQDGPDRGKWRRRGMDL